MRYYRTCQGTVPQALQAFFESKSFEDALRIAISVGGDSDTLAAITCSIAEVYYGVPKHLYNKALLYLDEEQKQIIEIFEKKFGNYIY
ncbi:MAG: ADP-ribosylglycohydrolase family protein [Oscillospiraceae bacterium]